MFRIGSIPQFFEIRYAAYGMLGIPYARTASNMRSVGTSTIIELKKVRDIPAFGIYFYTYEVLVGQVNLLNTKSSGMIINAQSEVIPPIFHKKTENRTLFICFK